MLDSFYIPDTVVVEYLPLPVFEQAGVELAVLRLDRTDAIVSGNKWFKLHYHLQQAKQQQAKGLISVGGVYSNHLHALAAAGQQLGLATVGLLRGNFQQTPTTDDLQSFGMKLHWLGYAEYRLRYQEAFWHKWLAEYPDYYPIPEGGGGVLGAKGCWVIPQLIKEQLVRLGWDDYDSIYVSVGTGSTLAGIVWGDEGRHRVVGCLAVPVSYGVDKQVVELLAELPVVTTHYQLQPAARKGFGQADKELLDYIEEVERLTGLWLDSVYTAKTLYFLQQQVVAGQIPRGHRVVFVHTGGLQGRRLLVEE